MDNLWISFLKGVKDKDGGEGKKDLRGCVDSFSPLNAKYQKDNSGITRACIWPANVRCKI